MTLARTDTPDYYRVVHVTFYFGDASDAIYHRAAVHPPSDAEPC